MAQHFLEEDGLTLTYPDSELVIGVVCAAGADYGRIGEYLAKTLPAFGYRAIVLRVSSFISETVSRSGSGCRFPLNQSPTG